MGSRAHGVCTGSSLIIIFFWGLLKLHSSFSMCEGEKRKLVIPSELGYGASGAPPKIPKDATLIFNVELVKIERREDL